MLRLRTTATASVLVLAGAIGMAWWMSAWPRMHDRATEAAVAARVQQQRQHTEPARPQARRSHAVSHPVVKTAVAKPPAPPAPVYAPSPSYPIEALVERRGGVVTLHVSVNGQGKVTAVKVADSSGDPQLDASARTTMRQWRFQPPADHQPTEFDYPVVFRVGSASATR
ncbi:MAG TPA: energy transducer TonB [Oleiagrimonas sp.]|nr:energy transducer TonB [Oleiagrimonas sp.]